jgi:hypothetical protein
MIIISMNWKPKSRDTRTLRLEILREAGRHPPGTGRVRGGAPSRVPVSASTTHSVAASGVHALEAISITLTRDRLCGYGAASLSALWRSSLVQIKPIDPPGSRPDDFSRAGAPRMAASEEME